MLFNNKYIDQGKKQLTEGAELKGKILVDTFETIIAIGTNQGNLEDNVQNALKNIARHFGEVVSISNFYKTEPVGDVATSEFLNGACIARTTLPPLAQMKALLKIEKELGRTRSVHWGDRIIDLDIAFIYKDSAPVTINTESLVCPHPFSLERDFVLVPSAELRPEGKIPNSLHTLSSFKNLKNYSLENLSSVSFSK